MLDPDALNLAAERSGLSPEQVAEALTAFRYVTDQLHDEPEWQPLSHMTMADCGLGTWSADGTAVTKQIQTPRTPQGWGKGVVYFVYRGADYDTFGEARAAELRDARDGGQVVRIGEGVGG